MIGIYKWVKSRWPDPVWSKVIANIIWAILTAFLTLIGIFIYKVIGQLSFEEATENTKQFFNKEVSLSYRTILFIAIFLLFLSLNKISLSDLLSSMLFPKRHFIYEMIFSNKSIPKKRIKSEIFTYRSRNKLTITPSPESLDWKLNLLVTYTYKNEQASRVVDVMLSLQKKYNQNILFFTDEKGSIISLLEDYYFQEFDIDIQREEGGLVFLINRQGSNLYKSNLFFGYNKIEYSFISDIHDFIVNVKEERFE